MLGDRIPRWNRGSGRISASTFVDYLRCPASADARLHRVFGPDTRASFSGGLAPRVFARHLGRVDRPGRFHQVCREEIGSSSLNMKMAGLGLGKPSMLAPLIDEVQALYQRFRSVPVEGFVGAEVELAAEPADGVSLVGKVDAVLATTAVPRLSTGKRASWASLLFNSSSTGCCGHSRRRASRPPGGGVCADGRAFFHRAHRAELEKVAQQVAEMVTCLRTAWASGAELEVCGGPWCRYCPLLEDCGEGAAAVGQGAELAGPAS